MKAKLTLENGKTIDMELTKEQEELINQSDKKTGYERVNEEKYFPHCYFSHCLGNGIDNNTFIDDSFYDNADYINNEKLAENITRADTLMRKLRRFAVENGGSFTKEEWEDDKICKYYIEFDHDDSEIEIRWTTTYINFGQIYFRSEEIAQIAIDTFKEDLLWYFQEYDDMLR